jgi:transketolase
LKASFGGVINAPISLNQSQLEDLRRIVLRTISKDQVLILTNVPRVPTSLTSVLREVSRRYNVPMEELRFHAQALRSLNLIDYGEAPRFKGVELTELGVFVTNLTTEDEAILAGDLVQTRSGVKPLGQLLKDIRRKVLQMIAEAGSGHLGASMSIVDILAILYFMKMQHDPTNPGWAERDRLILSKGHAAPALYSVLSEAGYFPEEELYSLRELGSRLHGHPDTVTPGVDVATGSLGQGLSVAVGMALAAKMDNASHRIYVVLGDGELHEGQVWEAAMTAAHYGLDNMVVIVDRNQYQLTGTTEQVKSVEPVSEKWRAFGWNVMNVSGHEIYAVLDALEVCEHTKGRPHVIVAKTTKGKGVSFMEGNRFSRSVPDASQLRRALEELEGD